MSNLRWLKLNKTGLQILPGELSHLSKLVIRLFKLSFTFHNYRFLSEISGRNFLNSVTKTTVVHSGRRFIYNMNV